MACVPTPHESLFETSNGVVHRCPCCGDYEVRFHDAVLTVTRSELRRFRETVGTVCETGALVPSCWQLEARTARQRATFTLWDGDAEELADLLDGTLAMLALDDLLAGTLGVRLSTAR